MASQIQSAVGNSLRGISVRLWRVMSLVLPGGSEPRISRGLPTSERCWIRLEMNIRVLFLLFIVPGLHAELPPSAYEAMAGAKRPSSWKLKFCA